MEREVNEPIKILEKDLWHTITILELPLEFVETLTREKIINMLKDANWKLKLYREWRKQKPIYLKYPIPNLSFLMDICKGRTVDKKEG